MPGFYFVLKSIGLLVADSWEMKAGEMGIQINLEIDKYSAKQGKIRGVRKLLNASGGFAVFTL